MLFGCQRSEARAHSPNWLPGDDGLKEGISKDSDNRNSDSNDSGNANNYAVDNDSIFGLRNDADDNAGDHGKLLFCKKKQ